MQPTGMWDQCKARNPFINQPLLGIILYHLSTRGVRCALRNTGFRKTQEDMVYDIGFAMVYLIKKWILPISIILFRAMLVPETIASWIDTNSSDTHPTETTWPRIQYRLHCGERFLACLLFSAKPHLVNFLFSILNDITMEIQRYHVSHPRWRGYFIHLEVSWVIGVPPVIIHF